MGLSNTVLVYNVASILAHQFLRLLLFFNQNIIVAKCMKLSLLRAKCRI